MLEANKSKYCKCYETHRLHSTHLRYTLPLQIAVGAKESETVVFAWIVFESKEHHDRINKAVIADPWLTGWQI